MVISFNSAYLGGIDHDQFGRAIIHELLHPFVPNFPNPDDPSGDHDRLDPMTDEAWEDIVRGTTTGGSS